MSKPIPTVMLIWVKSNENHEDIVVHIETVQKVVKVGDRLWSDRLDRFGKIESETPTNFYVRVE